MLPWKLRKRHILPVNQNLLSVYFSHAKFQLVSCNLSLAMTWQMTYTHKLPKLCSATLRPFNTGHIEYRKIPKISPSKYKTCNAKNSLLNRPSEYKPPGACTWNCSQKQSKTMQKRYSKARFRRRTFPEPNLIRLKADPNY